MSGNKDSLNFQGGSDFYDESNGSATDQPAASTESRAETAKLDEEIKPVGERGFDILENIGEAFFTLDQDWQFTYANRATGLLLSRPPEELLVKSIWVEYPGLIGSNFEPIYRAGMIDRVESRITEYYPDHERWYEVNVFPASEGITVYFKDVTRRKEAEAEIKQLSELNRNILESFTDGFFAVDDGWRFTYVNKQAGDILKETPSDLVGRSLWEVYPGLAGSEFEAAYYRTANEGVTSTFTAYYPDHDRWYEVNAYPAPIGITVYFRNVTGSVRTEESLRRSQAETERQRRLYDTFLSSTPDLAYVFDLDHRFTYANKVLLEMWGKTEEEAVGKTCLELGYEAWHAEMHDREIEQVRVTKQPIRGEVPFSGTFGRRIYDYIFVPILGADGEVEAVAGTTRDVTERKQMEMNLAFLAEISLDLTRLSGVGEIMQSVCAKIGEYLNLSLCCFVEINEAAGESTVTHDWHRKDASSIIGVYRLNEYLSDDFQRAGRAGEAFVVRDVFADSRTDAENYARLQIGSFVCMPIVKDGAWRFLLNIHDAKPRDWSGDEIELLRELTRRVWTRIEHARGEEEREQLLQSEQVARREAEQANRLKDEFLATLSHELRTPLNAILGWSQMLQNQNIDESTAAKALATIERNARSQSQLIDDILDVSRIITGKLRLNIQAIDLPGVIMTAVDAARPGAEAKNIRLQTLLDPQAGPISGDPDRLQQIVWNLLSNAVKFTPKNGRVQVRLERVNSHVEIVVSDTGKGIEPVFLPHVFDRFSQSDGSTTRRHGGLGLGLSIVRQLTELHGGAVSVESNGENQGSIFTVSLPLLPMRSEPAGDIRRVHPAAARTEGAIHCPPELDGLHILVVDDEADSRDLMDMVLVSCGAQVTTANSAAEALELIKGKSFAVIISDIGMPEEDGFSLIKKIRELLVEEGGDVPAIALTAYASSEIRVQALRSGFQMHLPKPVEPAELVAVVANFAGRTGKQNQKNS